MKQSKSVKVKMPAPIWPDSKREYLTLCYDHPDQQEFVFTIRGRPFSMLSTPKLPVPSMSPIDYNLVRDLGSKWRSFNVPSSPMEVPGSGFLVKSLKPFKPSRML